MDVKGLEKFFGDFNSKQEGANAFNFLLMICCA